LGARYQRLGATLTTHESESYGNTLVASFRSSGTGRVLLLGHMDTVYPLGTVAQRPFHISHGSALGPGVADMKSGDLAIVYALEALQQLRFDDFGHIVVVHNSDEEIGSPSSRDVIRAEAEAADAVLVLEAGRENGDIVSARKGIANFQLRVQGKSAHAGVHPERGRSAALELAHLVIALEGLNGTIPGATLNVGRIEAGERRNVVPDRAFAHFEARVFDYDSLQKIMDSAQEVVRRRTVPGTHVELDVSVEHYPMHKSHQSERLVALARTLAADLGFTPNDVATGGASDGNTAAAAGRPVLDGLGPVGGAAHSPDEYIEIDSIVPRTALLTGLIAAIATGSW
jgi:glutamate carboxypeptidase